MSTSVVVNLLQPCWILLHCLQVWTFFLLNPPRLPRIFSKSQLSHVHRVSRAQRWSTDDVIPTVSGFKPSESDVVIADHNWSITDDGDNICEHGLRLGFTHQGCRFIHANTKYTFSSERRKRLHKWEQTSLKEDHLSGRFFNISGLVSPS